MTASFAWFPDSAVRGAVDAADAVAVVSDTFAGVGAGHTRLSHPPSMSLPLDAGSVRVKSAGLPEIAGVRIAVRTASGMMNSCVLIDPVAGHPVAMIEESWLHRLRTAASAAATLALLHPPPRANLVVAIVGTGKIAAELVATLGVVDGIAGIRVAGRSAESARSFAEQHTTAVLPIVPVDDAAQACAGADAVITITSADAAVLTAAELPADIVVIALGGGPELHGDVLDWAESLYVDDLGYATTIGSIAGWIASGIDAHAIERRITATIGELAIGSAPPPPAATNTVAVVQGLAACDVALAHFAWQRLR